ncbi:MAG: hypothetical protein ACE5KM_13395 [Planctomycetaceae bacterium]
MDDVTPVLNVLFRWIHVGTAIVVLGGSVFVRFVLMPAAEQLPDAEHDTLRQHAMGRWRKFVGIGVGLFLISGFYNYLVVSVPNHKGDKLYHPLVGTKILLAFAVFFLASALTGRAAAFEGIRKNSKRWMLVMILLAGIIVAISGVLKVAFPPTR